ncbi:MAG: hypothetical protein BGP24_04730 [Lysobacterales bacterium 69-70]|nr:hypothetical protein [Xanthomonadaceae bacterium]ODU32362.1 MAG: hypothetical protein ABS97_16005 [Xanthomonadaceae bacterium SCN 69-320]ODV15829.1 MAG: hypothetical protein ABT27_21735 [Xanthomonadaceae bacterium SCN 69-25]OJY95469.1 MAG: hypothetical protein BGP24_04730 [Xanthomonadales bacterium 69-70]
MRLLVMLLTLPMLAGCQAAPVLALRDDVAPKDYREPTERPVEADRQVVLQFRSGISPLVRIHRVRSSSGVGLIMTDGGWLDRPVHFRPGTATFRYTCADGRRGENVVLTFLRAGSYTLDCAPDGSLVAIGPRAPAF